MEPGEAVSRPDWQVALINRGRSTTFAASTTASRSRSTSTRKYVDEEVDREKFAPTFVCEKSGFVKARKTAAEWAAINGRGLLCSTEY